MSQAECLLEEFGEWKEDNRKFGYGSKEPRSIYESILKINFTVHLLKLPKINISQDILFFYENERKAVLFIN